MRIDLFLKAVGLMKTRMAAKRLCEIQKVLVEGKGVKPSHEVTAGQTLQIFLPAKELRVKILEIPTQKSVAKHDRARYVETEILG